jgi:hypothetical protein
VACDTSTATDPSKLAPSVPSLAQDRLPVGTVIEVAFPYFVAPGTTFFVRAPSTETYCSNAYSGIGPHYLTEISYMGGGEDSRDLRNATETFASPHLPKGTRFRITGLYGDGSGVYMCGGGAYLFNAVVIQ